jgi:cytochrome c oxidase subunit 2
MSVTAFGFGKSAGGASRWIEIGPIHIQPAEIAKVAVILYLAYHLERRGDRVNEVLTSLFPAILLLGWFAYRYQAVEGAAPAAYWHDNSRLEWTWTLVTAGIMVIFTVNALSLWAQVTGPAPADALVVEVTGQQFAWNVRYAGPDGIFGRTDVAKVDSAAFNFIGLDRSDPNAADDIVLQNQLFLPEGRPVRVRLRSLDVIHSFFLPNFRVKQDAMPGMTTETWFVPQKAGSYELACAEHCGLGHYRMRGAVTVVPAAQLDAELKKATAE